MITKEPSIVVDGPNASGDMLDLLGVFPLPPGGIAGFGAVPTGLPLIRDLSQLVNVGTQGSVPTVPNNPPASTGGSLNTFPVGAPDRVQTTIFSTTLNGEAFGAFQGPFVGSLIPAQLAGGTQSGGPIVNPLTSPQTNVRLVMRRRGIGWLLCGVNTGGSTLSIKQYANSSTTFPFCVQGSRTGGATFGQITAYPINTTVFSAVAAGAGVVIPVNSPSALTTGVVGMTTAIPVTIGSGATAETVTPSAVTQGVFASQTITVGGGNTAGTATITIGGGSSAFPAVPVPVSLATSVTVSAQNIVAALNASAAALGLAPFIQLSQNAAGVVTVAAIAQTPAATYNAIPISASAVTGGNFTLTVGGATLTGGVNPSFTATIANPHAAGEPVQGINNSAANPILVAPAVGYIAAALVADMII